MFQGAAFKGDLKYALSQLLEETNYSTIAYDQTLPSKLESKAYIHLNTIKKMHRINTRYRQYIQPLNLNKNTQKRDNRV